MENADPLLIKLVVKVPVEGRETHTILSYQLILENGVMIIKLKNQLEGFKFVFIHVDSSKGD